MNKKKTFYRIDFVNWSEDYDYTIVPTLKEALDYLEMAEPDFANVPDKGEAPTSATITGVKMSDWQYNNFIKKFEP